MGESLDVITFTFATGHGSICGVEIRGGWKRGQIAITVGATGSAAISTEPVKCNDGELGRLGKAA